MVDTEKTLFPLFLLLSDFFALTITLDHQYLVYDTFLTFTLGQTSNFCKNWNFYGNLSLAPMCKVISL